MFQAPAASVANQPKLGSCSRLHRCVNRLQGFILLSNPVQRIERDDHVELLAVRQTASVSDLKAQVRVSRSIIVTRCECNHLLRRIYPQDRSIGDPGSDLRRDLSIAAADIKNSLRALEIKQ